MWILRSRPLVRRHRIVCRRSVCVSTLALALACMKWRCFVFVLHVVVPDGGHRVHSKIDCNVAKRMGTEHPV
jgi:hypothetical protein